MEKICFGSIILLSLLSACGIQVDWNEDDSLSIMENDENMQGKDVVDNHLIVDSELSYEELVDEIALPDEYKDYTFLAAVNEDCYFLADYDQIDHEVYIKVSRDDPSNIVELSKVELSDFTTEYVWEDNLYVDALFTSEDKLPGYDVLKVSEAGESEAILSGESSVYMSFANPYLVILSVSQEWENNLDVYNMETREMTHVYDCTGVQDEIDWSISGTIVNGMFWHGALPSAEGFCYMVSDMNHRTFDDGKTGQDIIYYYSFKSGESQELFNHHYIADYVGGTEEAILVSDCENIGYAEHVYIKNESGYDVYPLKEGDDAFGGFTGFGALDGNRYIAYSGEGFLILDAEEKTYIEKAFYTGSDTQTQADYPGKLRGIEFRDGEFYFATLENEKLQVYCIK